LCWLFAKGIKTILVLTYFSLAAAYKLQIGLLTVLKKKKNIELRSKDQLGLDAPELHQFLRKFSKVG
jgi:hypothetical protein